MDKLKVVHRTRDQVELSTEARRTNAAGDYPSTGFVAGGTLLVDDRLAAGATFGRCAEALRRAGGGEAEALTQYRTCRGVFKSLSSSADQENWQAG